MGLMILGNYLTKTLPENRIAIVANGCEDLNADAVAAIQKSKVVIAVDEGLNLCKQYAIRVNYLVGTLESIHANTIKSLSNVMIRKLDRTQDFVDVEAGLRLSAEVDRHAVPCIFNALAGRTDQHLNNLYLLLKYPNSLMCSNNVIVRSRTANDFTECGSTLFAFYEDAYLEFAHPFDQNQRFSLEESDQVPQFVLDRSESLVLEDSDKVMVLDGQLLEIISLSEHNAFNNKTQIDPLKHKSAPYRSESEEIHLLNAKKTSITLQTLSSLTISLVPLWGPVTHVFTNGLKWNLSGQDLTKDFILMSNKAAQNKVHIELTEGLLLVIVDKTVGEMQIWPVK